MQIEFVDAMVMFLFHTGSIKRFPFRLPAGGCSDGFYSILVRLKATARLRVAILQSRFYSILVRLKGISAREI